MNELELKIFDTLYENLDVSECNLIPLSIEDNSKLLAKEVKDIAIDFTYYYDFEIHISRESAFDQFIEKRYQALNSARKVLK